MYGEKHIKEPNCQQGK